MKNILIIIAVVLIAGGGYFYFTQMEKGPAKELTEENGEEASTEDKVGGEGYKILSSFEAPGSQPSGITWDGSNFWAISDSEIYKLDSEGGVIYTDNAFGEKMEVKSRAPGGNATGLAWGENYLWYVSGGNFNDGTIYKLSPQTENGSLSIDRLSSFDVPEMDGSGEAEDITLGDNSIWVSYDNPMGDIDEMIYEFDMDGNLISEFKAPGSEPSGLAWDGEYLWNGNTERAPEPGKIYKLDTNGNVISEFDAPDSWPGGMEWIEGNLWLMGSNEGVVYELEIK